MAEILKTDCIIKIFISEYIRDLTITHIHQYSVIVLLGPDVICKMGHMQTISVFWL